VITAVTVEGRSKSEVARKYGVSRVWVQKLVHRYQREGAVAFEPRTTQQPAGGQVGGGGQLGLLDWPDESALRAIATDGPPLIDKTTEALNAMLPRCMPRPPRQTMCRRMRSRTHMPTTWCR
jgi:hypothetical protein